MFRFRNDWLLLKHEQQEEAEQADDCEYHVHHRPPEQRQDDVSNEEAHERGKRSPNEEQRVYFGAELRSIDVACHCRKDGEMPTFHGENKTDVDLV